MLSLAFHGALALVNPGLSLQFKEPKVETIVVELLEEQRKETTLVVLPSTEAPAPAPQPAASAPMTVAAKMPPPPGALADAGPETAKVDAKIEVKKLPPLPDDMEVMEMTSYLPDPSGSGATEATINMSNPDARYKGFLDVVRAEVYKRWNSREALLAAKKAGDVTIRFTLVAGGGGSAAVDVLKSSGSQILDQEAVRAVQTARLPAFPNHWTLQRVNLVGEFQYAFSEGK